VCVVSFLDCLYICICECLFQNNNKKIKYQNKTNCGSAFEPGLPYYWASIWVRFGCIPRSSCVPGFKTRTPKKKPCYCAPPVCVPDVIGGLVVWWHNKTTLKNKKWGWHQVSRHMHGIINVRSTSFWSFVSCILYKFFRVPAIALQSQYFGSVAGWQLDRIVSESGQKRGSFEDGNAPVLWSGTGSWVVSG